MYTFSIGLSKYCSTINVNVLVEVKRMYSELNASIDTSNLVFVPVGNVVSNGWNEALPTIKPLSNNSKLGGKLPPTTLYCNGNADVAWTFKSLILPL